MTHRHGRARGLGVVLATALAVLISTDVFARLDSELREVMRGFAESLATLLEASTQEPLAGTAEQRNAINGALSVIGEHAGLMVQHLERDDVAFMAAALEKQVQLLRYSARSGDAAAFHKVLDRSIGTCVGCHARTSEASGTRLAARLLPPELEATLPTLRRARLQVATRRFEAARDTLEAAIASETGPGLMDILADYLAVMLRIVPDPARALVRVKAVAAVSDGDDGRLRSWQDSLEQWLRASGGPATPPRARSALSRARGREDTEHARVDYLLAVNEAERWLDRGIGNDADAASAYLVMGISEHALMPTTWLPLPELYLEQAIWLAPGSDTAREALSTLEQVLQRRFAADGMPVEVSDHLRALRRVAG